MSQGSNSGPLIVDDVEHFVNRMHTRFWQRFRQEKKKDITFPIVQGANGSTNASGNLNLNIYQNVTGKHLVIGRIVLTDNSHTPGNPFVATANTNVYFQNVDSSSLNLGSVFDFLPNASLGQTIPQVAEYSGHNAIRIKQNEIIGMVMLAGPANANINCTIFGFLEPTSTDYD